MRDALGVGRVGFVDLDAGDPRRIVGMSAAPALDIGAPGTFDENGVVPAAVLERDGKVFLYYAGYSLGHRVRFSVLCGLAISDDGGSTFHRWKQVPVLERSGKELLFRVIHSIFFENGVWRVWYGAGSRFRAHGEESLPEYCVYYLESNDGFSFPAGGDVCLELGLASEYRIGRPYVVRKEGAYRMFYASALIGGKYHLGFADSKDGMTWTRRDQEFGLPIGAEAWDNETTAYPAVFSHDRKTFLLYNGNRYGEEGFGCAVLEEW